MFYSFEQLFQMFTGRSDGSFKYLDTPAVETAASAVCVCSQPLDCPGFGDVRSYEDSLIPSLQECGLGGMCASCSDCKADDSVADQGC